MLLLTYRRRWLGSLAVGGAVLVHDPTSFRTQCLEHFVVVAMLGQLVVPVRTQACEDLGGYGSSTPLPSFVVLPLLPSRQSRS